MPPEITETQNRDFQHELCRQRIADVEAQTALAGTPAYDENRAEVLGRAVGEPVVMVTAPAEPTDGLKKNEKPVSRVRRVHRFHRYDKAALRERLLREGYVFSSDPHEALALVKDFRLTDLFADKVIYLHRGETVHRLERHKARFDRGFEYRHTEGRGTGRTAKLLFGDRVAKTRGELDKPLHRDVRALRDREGFDRIRINHRTEGHLVAELRFNDEWVKALLASKGARLDIACLDADKAGRERVANVAAGNASRRRAIAALQRTVGDFVAERLPFDRPRNAEDHFDDGKLRPQWEGAYRRGSWGFTHDEEGYGLFDRDGRPRPPQTCVEMVLDTFERASGNWFAKKGEPRKRTEGALNFTAFGIKNRAGVLGFERWAKTAPELFTHRRFPTEDRVRFKERKRFFAYLVRNADAFQAGDIVSIQGLKRDGYIHQHAILIEDVDPVTGMPFAMADQMKRPRRRTWEGIMAEAPLRSLLYHIKPTGKLLRKLDRGDGSKVAAY